MSAREEAGLSQREVAARLRVHHSWVAKVETRERRLDVLEFARLAKAIGRDPVKLFAQMVKQLGR